MINNYFADLLTNVENSKEYLEYKEIGKILEIDENIKILIEDIKKLQKEAIILEENNDQKYKELNKLIDIKVKELYNNPVYKKYLNAICKFNNKLIDIKKNNNP